jgi:NitT/TauT family transport system ATP-binding protein
MISINIRNISKAFEAKPILDNFSLHVSRGEIVAFLGPNGCGKSTLMNIIAGVMTPDSGTVEFSNPAKNRVGFVFQDYRRHLLPYRSVRDNILFPLQLRHVDKREQDNQLKKTLELTGDIDFGLDQKIHTLSGGQAQLASLMRALIINPAMLILDEPFSALDYAATLKLQAIILQVVEKLGLTTLLISHNIEEAVLMSDRLLVLTPRPAAIREILSISLPRQRTHKQIGSEAFAALMSQAITAFLQNTH